MRFHITEFLLNEVVLKVKKNKMSLCIYGGIVN